MVSDHIIVLLVTTLWLISSSAMGDLKLLNYTQRLDHFGSNKLSFTQRLLVDDTRWGGAQVGSPIFVKLGSEDGFVYPPSESGVLDHSANEFQAMLVHIEHRFYGHSIPLGAIDAAMADHQVRSFLTTDQALQDFAQIIQSLKTNYSAHRSPVIVVGIGYGGALATWFRLKYPKIAIGALASSTPLMYYGNTTSTDGYCSIVSEDFRDTDQNCYDAIRKSWKEIDLMASQTNGLAKLSVAFNTCRPIKSTDEVKEWLGQWYSMVAQYDEPGNKAMRSLCQEITGFTGENSIQGIANGLVSNLKTGNCFQTLIHQIESPFEPFSNLTIAWEWQRCTELIFPVGCREETMLPARPFDFHQFEKSCRSRFGVSPKPYTPIDFFDKKTIKDSLKAFGGNIIFSNGLRDPFSSGGILEDLSETIVAIKTTKGTFCLDMTIPNFSNMDPKWLIEQREEEIKIFRKWINHFHGSGSCPISCSLIITIFLQFVLFLYMFSY